MFDVLKEKVRSEKYLPLWLMTGYWLLIGLLEFLKIFAASAGDPANFDWSININFVLIYSFAWILITYPIYKVFQLFSEKGNSWKIVSQLFFSVLFSVIHILILSVLFSYTLYSQAKHGDSFFTFYSNRISANFLRSTVMSFSVYWVMILVLFTLDYYRKFKEKSSQAIKLESSLTHVQLQTLKMQLQPHFLFNAHNTIAMLIRTGKNDKAINIISKLSDLLRSSLTVENEQLVTLEKELELLNKYLEIEKARFEKNLEIELSISEDVKSLLVPNLILQPIVENAFKHGISKIMGKNRLEVKCYREYDNIILKVYNTGPGLEENFELDTNNGIGLINTKERLNQFYNDSYMFALKNYNKGVLVTIKIPINKIIADKTRIEEERK